MVGYALRHYSAVDVSVVGVRVTEVRERKVCNNRLCDSPMPFLKVCATKVNSILLEVSATLRTFQEQSYRGTLTSVFPDGARRERRVEGVVQRRYLNNIRPEYSRVYRIKPSVTVNVNQQLGDADVDEESEDRSSKAVTPFPTTEPTTTRSKWDLGSGWEKKSSRRRTDLMVSDQIKNNAEERQSAVISGSGVHETGQAGFATTVTSKVVPLVTCFILAVLLN